MRRTLMMCLTLACAVALATGCKKKDDEKKPEPAPKTTTPTTPEVKELSQEDKLKKVQECWAFADAKDGEKLKGCYHADAVTTMVDMVPPMQAKGPDATIALYKPFWAAFSDLEHSMGLVAVNGDKVATFFVIQGTNSGELMNMPASNKKISMWGSQVGELKDGKMVRDDHYFDAGTMMAQLGVSPNPMAPAVEQVEPYAQTTTVIAKNDELEKSNLAMIKKSEEAMKAKDTAAVLAMYADDAEFIWTGSKDVAKGMDAMKKSMEQWHTSHSALEVSTKDMWAAGDWVIAETTVKGTMAMDMPGLPKGVSTKGKSYESNHVEFIHIADGKIKKHHIYTNTAKWAADLGIMDPSKMGGGAAKAAPEAPAKN